MSSEMNNYEVMAMNELRTSTFRALVCVFTKLYEYLERRKMAPSDFRTNYELQRDSCPQKKHQKPIYQQFLPKIY